MLGLRHEQIPIQVPCNGSAKLTEKDIPEIFAMSRRGKYQHEIAEHFGVSQPANGTYPSWNWLERRSKMTALDKPVISAMCR